MLGSLKYQHSIRRWVFVVTDVMSLSKAFIFTLSLAPAVSSLATITNFTKWNCPANVSNKSCNCAMTCNIPTFCSKSVLTHFDWSPPVVGKQKAVLSCL